MDNMLSARPHLMVPARTIEALKLCVVQGVQACNLVARILVEGHVSSAKDTRR
jgi:hypothetical protein